MNKLFTGTIILIIALYVIFASIFTVPEGSSAMILRLGQIEKQENGDPRAFGPGLHFKTPFIENVREYDMRQRTLTIDSSRIVTQEQKDVLIDAYVQWKIADLSKFYRSTSGSADRAALLLKQYVESAMRAEVGKRTIQELINNERDAFKRTIMADVTAQAAAIGLQLDDVRIKQIDLPESVTDSIYQRMRSDREKEASKIRADGTQAAEKIQANADAQVTVLLAKARSDGKKIRAEGDGLAAQTYAKVYGQDPQLYALMRSLTTYQESFKGEKDTLILKPDGELFKYFNPEVH